MPVNRLKLTSRQESLWFVHHLGTAASIAYNEPVVYKLQGEVSIPILKIAIESLHTRHEALRMSFEKGHDGKLTQVYSCNVEIDFSFEIYDDNASARKALLEDISRPFNLGSPPLMRVRLARYADKSHYLLLLLHHIITDGSSLTILANELSTSYNRLMCGACMSDTVNYNTYSKYTERELSRKLYVEHDEKICKIVETMEGYHGANFATGVYSSDKEDLFVGDRVLFSIERAMVEQLKKIARDNNATLFHILLSAYLILLGRYSRCGDIAAVIPFANRLDKESKGILGYLVNILPVRVLLSQNQNFAALVKEVKSKVSKLFSRQDVAYEDLITQLPNSPGGAVSDPFLQFLFSWSQDVNSINLSLDGVTASLVRDIYNKTAKMNFSMYLGLNSEEISGYLEFKTSLFSYQMVENFVLSYKTLLANIITNPNTTYAKLSMLHRCTKKSILSSCNNIIPRREGALLTDKFSEIVRKNKNRCAVVFEDMSLTYQALESTSDIWASYIQALYRKKYCCSIPRKTRIGLCLERSEKMIIGMLSILKAGAAYVPIDPHYPQERVDFILSDAAVSLIVTDKSCEYIFSESADKDIVLLDDKPTHIDNGSLVSLPQQSHVCVDDAAYVLYTSGSTGKPKGVEISHKNIMCLFESLKLKFNISQNDVWSLFHTYCFDISVWEIWGALMFGGKLVIVPYELTRDPGAFYKLVKSESVTVLSQTASAFKMFLDEDLKHQDKLEKLKYVAFVGESLNVSMLGSWIKKYTDAKPRLVNLYGITETTIYTNYKHITEADISKGRDNIGRPLQDYNMFILDNNGDLCPYGMIGEIHIIGNGVANGYFNNRELTKEKFLDASDFPALEISQNYKIYKTGDLGRWLDNGEIEYAGRKDSQIKLRGFRIELGEIDTRLNAFHGIVQAVTIINGEDENAALVVYFVEDSKDVVKEARLKTYLAAFLPNYMVPQKYIRCTSFPTTLNGKIDRKALKELYPLRCHESASAFAPLTPVEEKIAEVWGAVLSINRKDIGRDSNFFELGGNSLLVVKMLSMLSSKLEITQVPINGFIATPYVSFLSSLIEDKNKIKGVNISRLLKRLENDSLLDQAIVPLRSLTNNKEARSRNVLITGATGFLGIHLLAELLEKTDSAIYCLVRGKTKQLAEKRLWEKLEKYQLKKWIDSTRIKLVLGDLSKENVGIDVTEYETLSGIIDTVYHSGAWVHHVYDYQTLYLANVHSTLELLRFVTNRTDKSFHFISTLNAQLINPYIALEPDVTSQQISVHLNGYLLTKWISEQHIIEARKRGVNAYIYRPGNIVSGSAGICEPENNHTLMRLKSYIQLGKAPESNETLEMMPVDILAENIVNLSSSKEKPTYNLHNPKTLAWATYVKFAIDAGYQIDFVRDSDEWQKTLDEINEENALYKLLLFYRYNAESSMTSFTSATLPSDIYHMNLSYRKLATEQINNLSLSGFLPRDRKKSFEDYIE